MLDDIQILEVRVKSHWIVRGESFACYGTCRFYDTIYDRSPDYFVYNHLTLRKFFYDIIYDMSDNSFVYIRGNDCTLLIL